MGPGAARRGPSKTEVAAIFAIVALSMVRIFSGSGAKASFAPNDWPFVIAYVRNALSMSAFDDFAGTSA